MATIRLEAMPRTGTTSSYKHQLRDHGRIPGVVYGKNMPSKLIEVDVKNLEGILKTGAGRNSIIDLTVQEEKPNKFTVMIKDLQRDPVKGNLLHADLQKISLKEKISTSVPIRFNGEAVGVKKGGIMQSAVRELQVECIPTDLPEHLDIDISSLDIGDSITVAEVKIEGACMITSDPSTVIVSVVAPRMPEADEEITATPADGVKHAPGEPDAKEDTENV